MTNTDTRASVPVPVSFLDGGLGTSLEDSYSITFGPSTPLWSSHLLVSDPSTLLCCQKDFGDVPVDVILTATYQVSLQGFSGTKTAEYPDGIAPEHVPRFLETAVQIAEQAKHRSCGVALSIGPYGACMVPSQEFSGKYDTAHDSEDDLFAWHRERMEVFAGIKDVRQRVRYIALETVPRLDEVVAMRRAMSAVPSLSSGVPFWISCLFPNEDENTPDGNSPAAVIRAMLDPSLAPAVPWGVGINCTKVWKLDSLLRRYEAAINHLLQEGLVEKWPALVLYPDGTNGEVYNTTTMQWEIPQGTEQQDRVPWETQLAEVVRATEARGEWPQIIVGGCCRARPSDIQRLRGCLST
ncbi:homocysteine s-methyltransferase domain-containing protein [Trichoderma breve]|uniref:Homocysteine s-methyltransferase domain-containing protein n=1 Tax=Trichoderma breve TaxID=2034170 RepID=A0A9W9BCK1_9HYPO|nr:homocysteine s-methyltransferase domain-containing protein [Trichoderma breve]KAJ4857081.1 homocysteine s-methyltransferase domain-containing protein [Trichoderma breve]